MWRITNMRTQKKLSIAVKSVKDHNFVYTTNRKHIVKFVGDLKYVNTTDREHIVKNAEDLKYVNIKKQKASCKECLVGKDKKIEKAI